MGIDTSLTRKDFLIAALGASGMAALPALSRANLLDQGEPAASDFTEADVAAMAKVLGVPLTKNQLTQVLAGARENRRALDTLRKMDLPNSVGPATTFVPIGKTPTLSGRSKFSTTPAKVRSKPSSDEDIAFLPVADLAELIKRKQISSYELTNLYLARIKRYSPILLNVITITEDLAVRQARFADELLAKGKYLGPLHGIPYGIKDLFAVSGYPTTWGAEPFKNQRFESDSEVFKRLSAAGAVCIAKTSVGALAMDDHWFRGKTRNPWNPTQGSSGSSAGSASGMAAGLFGFSIGTETLGSIMSPSHRCRVTGLRPTFGRVSRAGAMALSWTMDKVGPICRTSEDCMVVLRAIAGYDPNDLGTHDWPLRYAHDLPLKGLKVAILENDSGLDEDDSGVGPDDAVRILKDLGVQVTKVKFTPVPNGIDNVLSIEAAAAFESITLDGRVDTIPSSFWPGIFRNSMFASGVSYVNGMRARTLAMRKFEEEFADYDAILTSDRGSFLLITTNLTGHPQLYVPMGVDAKGVNRGVSIIGRLYQEGLICRLGAAIQAKTEIWKRRPDMSKIV